MNVIPIACLALLLITKVLAIAFYDSLMRYEYEKYRSEWEKDGSRRGMNWKPPASLVRSGFFGEAHKWGPWLINTPSWAQSDSAALGILFRFRAAELVGALAIIVFMIALVVQRAA